MSQASFYSTSMRWGVGGDGVMLHDSLSRGRVTAGGVNYPVPGGMIETAENLRRDYTDDPGKIYRLRFFCLGDEYRFWGLADGRFHLVWKTDRSWAGTCRQLRVTLSDGTTHTAKFSYR